MAIVANKIINTRTPNKYLLILFDVWGLFLLPAPKKITM